MGQSMGFVPADAHLDFDLDGPALQGSHFGRTATLYLYHTGFGRNRKNWTGVRLQAWGVDEKFELRLSGEGLGSWVAKKFGGQDIEVGDRALDSRFRIRGTDQHTIRRILGTPAVRALLLVARHMGSLEVSQGNVTHSVRSHWHDRAHFDVVLPLLAAVADAAEKNASRGSQPAQGFAHQ